MRPKRILTFLSALVMSCAAVLPVCIMNFVPNVETLGFAELVALEKEIFSTQAVTDIASATDYMAIVELDAVPNIKTQEFAVSGENGKELWTARLHVLEATVVNSLKGTGIGKEISIPLAVQYNMGEKEIKTAYWKSWYHGARFHPGDRLVLIGSQAALTPCSSAAEPQLIFIGDSDGNAFFTSSTMAFAAQNS